MYVTDSDIQEAMKQLRDEANNHPPKTWQHAANEWADAAINGVEYLKNVRDGLCTFDEAISNLLKDIEHARNEQPSAMLNDEILILYQNASKGFHVSKSCGPDEQYEYVSKFHSLDDLFAYEKSWTALMVKAKEILDEQI